jgi:hypothetical protein
MLAPPSEEIVPPNVAPVVVIGFAVGEIIVGILAHEEVGVVKIAESGEVPDPLVPRTKYA